MAQKKSPVMLFGVIAICLAAAGYFAFGRGGSGPSETPAYYDQKTNASSGSSAQPANPNPTNVDKGDDVSGRLGEPDEAATDNTDPGTAPEQDNTSRSARKPKPKPDGETPGEEPVDEEPPAKHGGRKPFG
ncbi:MAG: hypothetical protein HJJLKODD_00314 [Phycisphaerae bacterium]|nr:hypothetical protein [Phycisphaerae bacterium]